MINKLFFLAILTLVAGCAGSSSSSSSDGKFTINGKPAKEFYAQFGYVMEGDCNDLSSVHFRYIGSVDQMEIGRDVNGDPIIGRVQLALQGDGSYTGKYIESIYVHSGGGLAHMQEINNTDISGQWNVNGVNLDIEHVGRGEGGTFNSEPIVNMQIRGVDLDRLADGHTTMLGRVYSDVSPQGETTADYCARIGAP